MVTQGGRKGQWLECLPMSEVQGIGEGYLRLGEASGPLCGVRELGGEVGSLAWKVLRRSVAPSCRGVLGVYVGWRGGVLEA